MFPVRAGRDCRNKDESLSYSESHFSIDTAAMCRVHDVFCAGAFR